MFRVYNNHDIVIVRVVVVTRAAVPGCPARPAFVLL